jgi:hypothetical protein
MALEAIYAPAKFKLLEKQPVHITLDPDILRRHGNAPNAHTTHTF